MNTEELLEELRKKLERLQKLEAAFEGTGGSTKARKKKGPMTQETKDKISKKRKAAWAKKKKEESTA
jgi:hypothetical protein